MQWCKFKPSVVQVQSKHSLLLSNGREMSEYKVAYASAKTVLYTQVWVKFKEGDLELAWLGGHRRGGWSGGKSELKF